MTLSVEEQHRNQIALLERLLSETGDNYAVGIFAANDSRFADIYPTTWVPVAYRPRATKIARVL